MQRIHARVATFGIVAAQIVAGVALAAWLAAGGDSKAGYSALVGTLAGAMPNFFFALRLSHLAEDADPRVRSAAVRAIGRRFGHSEDDRSRDLALQTIEAALRDDALVALGAVEALTEIGGSEAARAEGLLDRPEPELLRQAICCLARHATGARLEALIPLVAHRDWSVRAEAIQALAERGVVRAVPPILRRLETEQDDFVRGVILRALERLEG